MIISTLHLAPSCVPIVIIEHIWQRQTNINENILLQINMNEWILLQIHGGCIMSDLEEKSFCKMPQNIGLHFLLGVVSFNLPRP